MAGRKPSEPPVLIISGPTGSGKSVLVHSLAAAHNVSVISADSRQIIRGFDIGSSKPTGEERRQYDYRMLDLIDPGQRYSAFAYARQAEGEIAEIVSSGRAPVVCGGSGLYLRALTRGFFESPPADPEIRRELENQAEELGPVRFHALLEKVDPISARAVHPQNVVRVVRVLEIFHSSGQTKSDLIDEQVQSIPEYTYCELALAPPTEWLYERINSRVEEMIQAGWESEVKDLVEEHGIDKIRAARAIGYGELCDHLEGDISLDESIELIKRNTRRFAKRQMTWLRGTDSVKMYEKAETVYSDAVKLLNNKQIAD